MNFNKFQRVMNHREQLKKVRLLWTFYKSFFPASFIITLLCLKIFWNNGLQSFSFIFWFKLCTLWLIYYYIKEYKKHEFYYYQNLGISKARLWTITLTLDFAIFLVLLEQVYRLK
jgi:uncharacterized protein with PQ loop repeat